MIRSFKQSKTAVLFIALMLIVLCLFSLSACGRNDDTVQQSGTSDAAVSSDQDSPAVSSTDSSAEKDNSTDNTSDDTIQNNASNNDQQSDKTEAAQQSDTSDAASAALTDILTDLSQKYHIGVAGSSMTAVSFAAQLLDWAADTDNAAGIAADTAEEFTASLDEKAKTEFPKQIEAIYATAQDLCSDDGQSLLQGCGYEAVSYPWSTESMEELFSALQNI